MLKKLFVITLGASLFFSCGTTAPPKTAEVSFKKTNDGVITVSSKGYGKKEADATKHAHEQAFNILFFKGLPNSNFDQPMISADESRIKAKHAGYFESFYASRYKEFVVQSSPTSEFNKKAGVIHCNIKINYNSLRRDLESKGVLRKFGL